MFRGFIAALLLLMGRDAFAGQAVLDLRGIDWSHAVSVPIQGDWQFYWEQLLSPQDIESGLGELTALLPIHAEWHKTNIPHKLLNRLGSATYSITLLLPASQSFDLLLPVINSASLVWINHTLVQDFGRVALQSADAKGFVGPSYHTFASASGEITITIQASNHVFWFGGIATPPRLGLSKAMQTERVQFLLRDSLMYGLILFMAFYHIYIWGLLRRTHAPLFFGLFCLAVVMRSSVTGDGQVLRTLWPAAPMSVNYFLEYFGLASCLAFYLGFIRSVFPAESPRFLFGPLMAISAVWSLIIIVGTPRVYPFFTESFQFVMIITGILSIGSVLVASIRKRSGALLNLAGIIAFVGAVVNDIIVSWRVMDGVPLVHFGLILLLLSQSFLLARRFAHAFEEVERAKMKEQALNVDLEDKVRERTKQINTILDHAQSGFLLVDRNGLVQDGYTASCHSILGQPMEARAPFQEFMGATHGQLQFRMAIDQIFAGDLPEVVALEQIPSRFYRGDQVISLRGAAVRNTVDGGVESVLLTINNVTDLAAAEESLRHAAVLIRILEDASAFRIFLADFKDEIKAAVLAIRRHDQQELRSIVHTMKGNAATFDLTEIVEKIHAIEDQDRLLETDILAIEHILKFFLQKHASILQIDYEVPEEDIYRLLRQDLQPLESLIKEFLMPQGVGRFQSWMRSITGLPLRTYTHSLAYMAKRVAESLQKQVVLEVRGADIKVDRSYRKLLATLGHIVRNAIVHGIEHPDERLNKPEEGSITLSFFLLDGGGLKIVIADDGRGLLAEKILTQAKERGIPAIPEAGDVKAIFNLIFHPGFSTAQSLDTFAGRGMGLAAVASVQELGGSYEVKSQRGLGTEFILTISASQLMAA